MTRLSQIQKKLLFLSQEIANLGFLPFHQNHSKSVSETEGCAKMNLKGRKRKKERKRKCRDGLMDKSPRVK
jgi:hypothetical protein